MKRREKATKRQKGGNKERAYVMELKRLGKKRREADRGRNRDR